MLSEVEKRELLEMAASAEVRSDFDRLSLATVETGRTMALDDFVAFLDAMGRLAPSTMPRTPWVEERMLL